MPNNDRDADSSLTPIAATVGHPRRQFILGAVAAGLVARVRLNEATGSGSTVPADTRSVAGSRGPVDVPADPKRVAALVGSADVDVLTLGIEPVYAGSFALGWTELPESTVAGELVPPSPEAVAATRPDLLIGWDWLVDDPAWAGLAAIAPAVPLPEDPDTTWRDVYRLVADAVNRSAEGEAQLAAFDERVAELRKNVEELDPISVNYIGVYDTSEFWWWQADYPANEHLGAVGIEVQAPEESALGVSMERLSELTAPTLILAAAPEVVESLKELPLWSSIPAVKNDRVIVVDNALWGGAGLVWANAMLDEFERLFLA